MSCSKAVSRSSEARVNSRVIWRVLWSGYVQGKLVASWALKAHGEKSPSRCHLSLGRKLGHQVCVPDGPSSGAHPPLDLRLQFAYRNLEKYAIVFFTGLGAVTQARVYNYISLSAKRRPGA